MSKLYQHYENNAEHVWYESSNVLYSKCFDCHGREKPLSVTFKNGATYLYEGVLMEDYVNFREAESQGKTLVFIKKKYPCKRLADTALDALDDLREAFQASSDEIREKAGGLAYRLAIDDVSGEFKLYYADRLLYEGLEGHVFISRLFPSLGINFTVEPLAKAEDPEKTKTDE